MSNTENEPKKSLRPSVLLVDDEVKLLSVNKQLLAAMGLDVNTASSGMEAVEFLRQNEVDLIVLDMVMPGMDGVATMRKIREDHPNQKIIILSAYSEPDQVREAQQLGAMAYVQKPAPIGTLSKAIETSLAKHKKQETGMND